MTGALPVARDTIAGIVGARDSALSSFAAAHDALAQAYEKLLSAHRQVPGRSGSTSYDVGGRERAAALLPVVTVPPVDDFLASARFHVDRQVWGHLVALTELERLMDKTAKDGLRQQLLRDPPEVTVGNVEATLEQFVLDADMIFKRGLAAAFSALDRRFRSHDGWKIGSRVILDRAFDDWGHWSHYSNKRDTLQDIERVFHVLDGKALPASYTGIVGAVDESRRHGRSMQAKQSEAESEYFTARCFLNGNLHLWFKRDDLLERVNRLLGEFYGAPIPEERESNADDGLHQPKTTLAKNYGFFPTPQAAATSLVDGANLHRRGDAPLTVLEPSAGTGNLVRLIAAERAIVDAVEAHLGRAAELRASRLCRRVTPSDFLLLQPDAAALYDRVVMNPPFDRERDIDHVLHALKFLKPGGFLTAIMSAGTEFRDTRKSTAFRALMTKMSARWQDLPPGSFAEAGTYCNTVILRVWADGREFWS